MRGSIAVAKRHGEGATRPEIVSEVAAIEGDARFRRNCRSSGRPWHRIPTVAVAVDGVFLGTSKITRRLRSNDADDAVISWSAPESVPASALASDGPAAARPASIRRSQRGSQSTEAEA